MTLPREFWEALPQKSDAELYEILSREEDYLPEALAAAKDELSKRNVAPERIAELEKKVESEKKEETAKAELRLALPLRVMIFLFCGGIFGILLALYYGHNGYKRKASDCWVTIGASALCHFLLGGCLYLVRSTQ